MYRRLTDVQRRMLQRFAHDSIENVNPKEPGWARWGIRPQDYETTDDIEKLEDLGLIRIRHEYMDNWIKVTEAGWAELFGGR